MKIYSDLFKNVSNFLLFLLLKVINRQKIVNIFFLENCMLFFNSLCFFGTLLFFEIIVENTFFIPLPPIFFKPATKFGQTFFSIHSHPFTWFNPKNLKDVTYFEIFSLFWLQHLYLYRAKQNTQTTRRVKSVISNTDVFKYEP